MTDDASPRPGEMSLVEHLAELRTRIVRIALAVVLGAIVAWFFYDEVSTLLLQPYCALEDAELTRDCRLRVDAPLEGFSIRIRVSMLVGLFLGGPVVFWQVWRFIVPGLTRRERRYAAPFVLSSQVMFGLGIAFAWFVLPQAIVVLARIAGDAFRFDFRANEYIGFVLTTSFAFGVVFLLPVMLTFLGLAGVVSAAALRRARPYAIIGQSAVAAVVTPTTDPLNMLAMLLPMMLFYEISILLTALFERRRRRGRTA